MNGLIRTLILAAALLLLYVPWSYAGPRISAAQRAALLRHVTEKYSEQTTNPEKKNRKTMSQFGYNLYEFQVPVFPITKFIDPEYFGMQSYGRPDRMMEKNGALYTCRGGFIDFSHARAAVNWTVYFSLKILADSSRVSIPGEAGILTLELQHLDDLSLDDITSLAQKIAFERLVWHEIASWHYHKPYHNTSEQQSTFTPEDNYSNFVGTEIGKKVVMRMLYDTTNRPYREIAAEEIGKYINSLEPVLTKKDSRLAYDIVDRNKQRKLPADARNNDVWYDSRIIFKDQRYIFKRNIEIGPSLTPWLVPNAVGVGCPPAPQPVVLNVPQLTGAGVSLYNYYTFTITPDPAMFYSSKKHRQLHPAFGKFTTRHINEVVAHLYPQMEKVLSPGFDRRDSNDPVPGYSHIKKVFLK